MRYIMRTFWNLSVRKFCYYLFLVILLEIMLVRVYALIIISIVIPCELVNIELLFLCSEVCNFSDVAFYSRKHS